MCPPGRPGRSRPGCRTMAAFRCAGAVSSGAVAGAVLVPGRDRLFPNRPPDRARIAPDAAGGNGYGLAEMATGVQAARDGELRPAGGAASCLPATAGVMVRFAPDTQPFMVAGSDLPAHVARCPFACAAGRDLLTGPDGMRADGRCRSPAGRPPSFRGRPRAGAGGRCGSRTGGMNGMPTAIGAGG